MKATGIVATALFAGAVIGLQAAQAQQEGITRADLLKHDLGIPGREVVQVRVDLAPGVAFPLHSHPGVEVAFVLEGEIEYQFKGEAPVTLKAGQSLFIPAGTIHSAKNLGSVNAAELATYIVETGKPIVVLDEAGAQ